MKLRVLLLVLLIAAPAAGCGEDVPTRAVERDTPAVTSPGTDLPYESGGGDGSGADGSEQSNPRGGIAAGPDNQAREESGNADETESPTEGETGE